MLDSARRRTRRGGPDLERWKRRQTACGLFHSGGRSGSYGERIQRIPSAEVACLHDPLVFRGNGGLSTDAERQDRPQVVSGAGNLQVGKRRRLRRASRRIGGAIGWNLAKGPQR